MKRCALPQLIDPCEYAPCDWDLLADGHGREMWIDIFESQSAHIAQCAVESGAPESLATSVHDELLAIYASLRMDPRALGDELNILVIDRVRDGLLRERGIADAFFAVKQRETARAVAALPARLEVVDGVPEEGRLEELIRGVLGGNLFDMGTRETAGMFVGGAGPAFEACLERVPGRPWGIDDVDEATLDGWKHAVLFVDNAGADAVLGMLPLARELARRGARVTLAANETPSLNDITAAELSAVVDSCEELRGLVRVLSTGSADPLIDLSDLDAGFCDGVADADLVVLEGMGRGLESNWTARLSCETWRIAIVKAAPVALKRGVGLFDGVFRRDAAGA